MPTPPRPRDLFTGLGSTIDASRRVIASLGLRTYRSFLVVERFSGDERGDGELAERTFVEIDPPPAIDFLSASRIAASGGAYESGAVQASKITRTLTREQILGLTESGDPRDRRERFAWGIVQRGGVLVKLYRPVGEPILEPLGWRVALNPTNRRFEATELDV